jgi:hypothetical protein
VRQRRTPINLNPEFEKPQITPISQIWRESHTVLHLQSWVNRGKRRNLFDDHQAQGGNTYVMQFRLKTFGFRIESGVW